MQRLAQQSKTRSIPPSRYANMTPTSKRRLMLKRPPGGPSPSAQAPSATKRAKTDRSPTSRDASDWVAPAGKKHCLSDESSEEGSNNRPGTVEDEPFDVFKHPAIEDGHSEKQYEMRRMWDAWAEQMPWLRRVGEVEESCGVSRNVVMEFYRSNLYPRRKLLLQILKDTVTQEKSSVNKCNSLRDAPFASMLLNHISTAAPLMSAKGSP